MVTDRPEFMAHNFYFFHKDPNKVSQQGAAEARVMSSIVLGPATEINDYFHIFATNVVAPTLDANVDCHHRKKGIDPGTTEAQIRDLLAAPNKLAVGSLPTPINVNKLEDVLSEHPD